MTGEDERGVVARSWAAMAANDFRAAGELLHDDYVLDWPQSGERVHGRDNFVAINEHYPAAGPWQIDLRRIVGDDSGIATEVDVTDGVRRDRAITFSELRDGRILRQIEYWPEPMEAASWRARWVERTDG